MKLMVLIPARGGSKRLIGKNIFPFLGKPLVQHVIETAKKLSADKVFISTDSDEVAKIGYDLGVEVLRRGPELATDTTSTYAVVEHAVKIWREYDAVLLLQPTSPILRTDEIEKAISIFKEKNLPALVSANSFCKFSGGYILVRVKDLLKQKTLWVKDLHIRTDDFGDIDDLSDLRCLEAFLLGRVEEPEKFHVG